MYSAIGSGRAKWWAAGGQTAKRREKNERKKKNRPQLADSPDLVVYGGHRYLSPVTIWWSSVPVPSDHSVPPILHSTIYFPNISLHYHIFRLETYY